MERRVVPVEILDWYDGLVTGVVRLSWEDGWFLASLLSWSQESRRRAFGLIRVQEVDVERIKHIAGGGQWPDVMAHLQALCCRATGEALVVSVDERSDVVLAAKRLSIDDLRDDMLSQVERALAPERRKWLSVREGVEPRQGE